MQITVCFYSYFKDLTGCALATETLPEGSTLGELFERMASRFPRLSGLQRSALMAVGVEYQGSGYLLKPGDEVSFFPPVQGG
jgi:molybdopterin converting factor small subunit